MRSTLTRKSIRASRASAFTLVELLVAIGIIAVLAALLFPTAASMRERSQGAGCLQNLRKIGQGINQYTAENGGFFPPHWGETANNTLTWYGFIAPYVNGWDGNLTTPMGKEFFCPADLRFRNGQTYTSTSANCVGMSYGYNYFLLTQNAGFQNPLRSVGVPNLSKLVLVCDIPTIGSSQTGAPLPGFMGQFLLYPGLPVLGNRHGGGSCNLVFGDGHVESRNARRMANPDEEFDYANWSPR